MKNYTYEKWNKQTPINGASAETMFKSDPSLNIAREIYLVKNGTGKVERYEDVDTIKSVYDWEDLTDDQAMQNLVKQMNNPPIQTPSEPPKI